MRILILNVFLFFVLLFACTRNTTSEKEDDSTELQSILAVMLMTPDSLRTVEEKKLMDNIEFFFWNNLIEIEGKFVLNATKEEWLHKKIPAAYYDIFIQEVVDLNIFLQTDSLLAKQVIESFYENRQVFFRDKK
jgi:hypothetical protein